MRFDGSDYDHERDSERLKTQLQIIEDFMDSNGYKTLQQIADATGFPAASVSAQLRNLRKARFGARTVEKKHIKNGLYSYRLLPKEGEQ